MNNRERIVIYGALSLLALANLATLCGQAGPSAAADPATGGDQLGPAETLTLIEDESQLVLRNRGERLAWSDNDHARAFSIAFVHVGRAVGPLLEAEQYTEELVRLREELQSRDQEMTERIAAFMEENRDVDPSDPSAVEIQRAYQGMLQELERVRMEGTQRLDRLRAEHIERAYRDLVAAVEVVAQRRQIDIVLRFVPTANEFQAQSLAAAYTGVRARIALKYPEALDITDAVLEELAIAL
ncbi:MAG: OmpH family outer membrane protein [Planctomycetota bacterium]|jgi:Skp family chaperone for outer membrane proteins